MKVELMPVTPEAMPFCNYLYNNTQQNSGYSFMEPAEGSFDVAVQRIDSIFKLVVDTKQESQVVGLIGLEKIRWVDRVAQTMVCIAESVRSQNYAYEAYKILLNDFTNKYNLRKMLCIVNADSHAEKLIQKVGFIKEGTLRQEKFVNGKYIDGEIYGWITTKE